MRKQLFVSILAGCCALGAARADELDQEKQYLELQRSTVTAAIAGKQQQANVQKAQALAKEQENVAPAGLIITAPPMPRGSELYTIQAEKVKFRNVILFLGKKAHFAVSFDSTVDHETLETRITTDLRLVPLDDALNILTGMVGLRYRTGKDADGLQVLVMRVSPTGQEEALRTHQKDAVDGYTRLMLKYPQNDAAVNACFRIAEIYFDQGEYAIAAQNYKLLMDRDSAGKYAATALLKLGRCYSELGAYDSASKALYNYLDTAPETENAAVALLALARSATKAGDTAEAIRAYRRLLLEHPTAEKSVDALYELGGILYDQKEYEMARRQYDLLKTRHPSFKARAVRYRIAMCLMLQEKWQAAAADFAQLLKQDDHDSYAADSYYDLAKCLDNSAGNLEALEAYTGAAERYPTHNEAGHARARIIEIYRTLGLLQKSLDYGQQSINQFTAAAEEDPAVRYQYAVSLLQAKEYEKAQTIFEGLADADDGISRALVLAYAGEAARKTGNVDRAEILYRQALKAQPTVAEKRRAMLGLGDTYLDRGEYDKAASIYQGLDPAEKKQ